MNILAFDTSMAACSAAVVCVDGEMSQLFLSYEELAKGHAEKIVPMIRHVMKAAGLTFSDLERIAVTTGPGTFTGVRIGIATAKGLRFASSKQVMGISSLRVIAEKGADELQDSDFDTLAVAIDARRGQVYFELFDKNRNSLCEPLVCNPDIAAGLIPKEKAVVIGSGAKIVSETIDARSKTFDVRLPAILPSAGTLASFAARLTGQTGELKPLYLRQPDAKPQTGKAIQRSH